MISHLKDKTLRKILRKNKFYLNVNKNKTHFKFSRKDTVFHIITSVNNLSYGP